MPRKKLDFPNFHMRPAQNGYYLIRYNENGRSKTKSTGTHDKRRAHIFLDQFIANYKMPSALPNALISDIIGSYCRYRGLLIARPETLPYVFAAPLRLLGNLHHEQLTQTIINDYIIRRAAEPTQGRYPARHRGAPVSEATISKELRMVRAALNWATAEGLIDRPPKFRVELSAGKARDTWITKAEAARLVAACSPHIALFVRIALATGKRRGAILELTWDRVDLKRPGHEFIDFGDDVGKKLRGTTPIAGHTPLIDALRSARECAVTPYVIEWRRKPVRDVKVALAAAGRRAGIPHISSHMLKHTAISWMVQAGVPYPRIAKFTNTSIEMIERVYGHHAPNFAKEAIDAVKF
ncbi:tyrosine-type recombinase/integrase [Azospirillum oryzae]|uniref:Tyrosine-type recombinase/integrase n=1 Tax=Azospirillum oryzae TaxID=286727 RepID=A0A6N1ANU9_9PROT|nr:tyrosine-type recombinase/integrase [Azospirillum oryzae]KAA0590564.1 tyrosine-type recombinase/integrase [Azospirillum oryzae]QKS52928.1 tyrosine-type recombinase/integrase [Azospirillum oryzae]GLR80130.1 hypothetical protein GCM10007856_28070 [Azospirillum oryzae]